MTNAQLHWRNDIVPYGIEIYSSSWSQTKGKSRAVPEMCGAAERLTSAPLRATSDTQAGGSGHPAVGVSQGKRKYKLQRLTEEVLRFVRPGLRMDVKSKMTQLHGY